MQILSARNPVFGDAAGLRIDLLVTTDIYGELPFTAFVNDTEKHGRDLYAAAIAGDFGPIAPFVKSQAAINLEEKQALAIIDRKSIRDIRAYIASRGDAPQNLKDMEAEAIARRGNIK